MDFVLFNTALDANGFHFMFFDFLEHGALFRIGLDVDRKSFNLHLFGFDIITIGQPYC